VFQPANSITSALANEFNEASDPVHRASLIELGLVLFLLTFVVLALSRLLIARIAKGEGTRA
jgi:phosphate transport system permease protein